MTTILITEQVENPRCVDAVVVTGAPPIYSQTIHHVERLKMQLDEAPSADTLNKIIALLNVPASKSRAKRKDARMKRGVAA